MKSSFEQIKFTQRVELQEEKHIYKEPIMDLVLSALLQVWFLGSEQNRPSLRNEDVVKLAKACLSESVIVRIIAMCDSDFDTSRTALLNLYRCEIGMRVVEAILSRKLKLAEALSLMNHSTAA